MHRKLVVLAVFVALLALPAAAVAGHGLERLLDHPSVGIAPQTPPSPAFVSGGRGATWDPIATFATGNPHTDLDFFTQRGNTYASVGTLGIGPNAGGQEIFQLTERQHGRPARGEGASRPPPASATRRRPPASSTTSRRRRRAASILNADVLDADRRDTQILLDATDAPGRCHDQGTLGIVGRARRAASRSST